VATRAEVTVAVRVRPRASRTAVGGSYPGPNGPALVVAVPEPAVDGRATRAVLAAVAEALGVPRSRVQLRTGERSRDKLLTIVDPPADLAQRLQALRGDSARSSTADDGPSAGGRA
jgi:uncharacterized protein YggU (UPF0235/DUF167 family)